MPISSLQGEFVAERPKTEQATVCDVTEITIVPKRLSGKGIAQVDLDKRNLNGEKSISQRDTGMREATGVQNDKINTINLSLLDSVDEFMLGITLEASQFMSKVPGQLDAATFNVGKAGSAVDIGLA